MTTSHTSAALGRLQKWILYATFSLLWLSGAVWLYLKYFGQSFGSQVPSTQNLCMKIHGAAAMVFLVVLGALLPYHVRLGWRQNHQRPSGTFLLIICGVLTLTGWGLYYIGNDEIRGATSAVHSLLGLGLVVLMFAHVWLAARRKRVSRRVHRQIA